MECTFAINSTAPGFVLIQDEHSQYTINTTLQRHEGDVSKGSVNITDLPAGEYRVTVYDEMEDYLNNLNPAYQLHYLIHVLKINDLNPTSTSSAPYVTGIFPFLHIIMSFIVFLFVDQHMTESLFVSVTSTMFLKNGAPSPTLNQSCMYVYDIVVYKQRVRN